MNKLRENIHFIIKRIRLKGRYKKNKNKGGLIYLGRHDRGLGATSLVTKDAVMSNIPILVPTMAAAKGLAHKIYLQGQLGILPAVSEKYAMDHLVVTPNSAKFKEKCIHHIYVDNSCHEDDVFEVFGDWPIKIVNGFVTKRYE